ncbi:putative glutathione S-transferase [Gregarina niphandrodes]|uniref:Glutathione S-transferase n=1 Tax=Gregarina niphandrodes TaxID=110365 RepID=A0A023B0W0_GRENI|nr:putative glutathione S-transferase [Gregarina niphandrodes]EZG46104.1 putative glutathione S-transferase [Gregarina niphandrodes]|eukprot:XP_011132360.1 putative glutathione S-transferase [Gregarina niphandrodes]
MFSCCQEMPSAASQLPRLAYFDFHGRGEPVRLAFAISGRAFEDYRIKMSDWASEKAKAPSGMVPYLLLPDGSYITEMLGCLQYAGRDVLIPEDPLQLAYMHQFMHMAQAVWVPLRQLFACTDAEREAIKADRRAECEPHAERLEKEILRHQGGAGFCVNNTISLADIVLYSAVHTMTDMTDMDFTKKFPAITRVVQAVKNHPAVKQYYAAKQALNF